ncbi:Lipase [Psilocybe cubensis]|uniref:Fungal lipase-type domain-containing protein n=2 Tax=Psilocybe cubensis TaxID=181762 RepID=A0A8H8CP42_PSICU|nr:Lipase [Psilocybe cubensis]KAH9485060.1 Lipase [Psilocybe cubensis]
MRSAAILSSIILLALKTAFAIPTNLQGRSVTALSSSELSGFAPFTQFARAAYCPTSKLQNWSCGDACKANSDFQPTLVGGDGNAVQIFFVGFSPSQNSIIVAHEGTDPTQLLSDLTDIDILMGNLDSTLFPGVSSSVQVHEGFRDEHAKTATTILAEVKRLMSVKNTKNVAIVGHSLGGALSELDSLFLTLNLPSSTSIKAITYGTPRVGNPDFAQLIDSKVPNFKRINNEDDIVPIVPGRFLGFAHPHGEVHILSPGNAVSCPGDDDATDPQCQIQSVPNVLVGNILNHLGPYEGINIGTIFCT